MDCAESEPSDMLEWQIHTHLLHNCNFAALQHMRAKHAGSTTEVLLRARQYQILPLLTACYQAGTTSGSEMRCNVCMQVATMLACICGRFRAELAPEMGGEAGVLEKQLSSFTLAVDGGLHMHFHDRSQVGAPYMPYAVGPTLSVLKWPAVAAQRPDCVVRVPKETPCTFLWDADPASKQWHECTTSHT